LTYYPTHFAFQRQKRKEKIILIAKSINSFSFFSEAVTRKEMTDNSNSSHSIYFFSTLSL